MMKRELAEKYCVDGECDKYKTVTVGELIEALQSYDPTMPVYGAWEGILCPVWSTEMIEWPLRDPHGVLVLNVDTEPTQ